MYGTKKTRVLRIEARRRPAAAIVSDRSRWDWYALSCSCGLPAGECREHPRSRSSQRPPHGRLACLGLRGRARGGQDACWGLLDPAPRPGRRHEARLPTTAQKKTAPDAGAVETARKNNACSRVASEVPR